LRGARGAWWWLPTARPSGGRWSSPAEIGLQLLAGEHKWGFGKPARGSVEALGGRWLLPTAVSTSPEGRSERRKQLELGMCTTKAKRVQTVSLRSPGLVGRRRRGEEVSVSTERGGDDVAADGRLGTPWRAEEGGRGEEQARGRKKATRGERESRRWTTAACTAAAGGAAPAAEQGRQGTEGANGRKEGKGPKDLCVKLKDPQGPLGKLIFSTDVEIQ
jgi:hypothetical protein